MTKTLHNLKIKNYEIILVNDGSPDNSKSIALDICNSDSRVHLIDLSRNFGHHKAMKCGLQEAIGDMVFLIDVDLEEEPENLELFINAINQDIETDIVVGIIEEKKSTFIKRFFSKLFYKTFNFLSNTKIKNNEGVSRLMKRNYLKALLSYNEKEIFYPAIWIDAGFNRKEVLITKNYDGFTTYTFKKRLEMSVEAITSYSNKPLIFIFYLGLNFILLSLCLTIFLIIKRATNQNIPIGWTSIATLILMVGGVITSSLGIIGIYLSKIFTEVKARPTYLIRRKYNNGHLINLIGLEKKYDEDTICQ